MGVEVELSSGAPPRANLALRAISLSIAVCILGYLSVAYMQGAGGVAAIWPGNALIVCALLRAPAREWPALSLAAVVGMVTASLLTGDSPAFALGFALINAAECWFCGWACRRAVGRELNLSLPRHLVIFGLVAGLAAPLLSGLAGAGLFALKGAEFAPALKHWVLSDGLGLIVVTPALLALSSQDLRTTLTELGRPRSLAAMLLLILGLFLSFGPLVQPMPFLLFPALLFCALTLSEAGVGMCLVVCTVAAIVASRTGVGAVTIMRGQLPDLLLLLQLYLATATLMALSLSAAFNARRRFQKEAERAAEAKAAFMANISHEIRTPLTAVVGYAALLARRADLPADARTQIARIADAGDGLLSIVNDVLDFSKIEAGRMAIRPEPASPTQVVRSVLAVFAHRAEEKGISLVADFADGMPDRVHLDPNRLRQILVNLVGNAVKFTEAGQVAVTVAWRPAFQHLDVRVRDTGCGMDAAQQKGLFERFSQVDASPARLEGGTGLGLAISRDLVHAMGGEISVASVRGQGSEFAFTLDAPPCEALESAAPTEASCDMSGIRVLVVDDNPINRDIARAILSPLGVTIAEAADGAEAVEKGQESVFDLILMDLRMPRMNGSEAARRLRSQPGPNRAVPILAFSADIDAELVAGADGAFNGYVRKPLQIEDLIEAVESALAA